MCAAAVLMLFGLWVLAPETASATGADAISVSLDHLWVLVAVALVALMQIGFSFDSDRVGVASRDIARVISANSEEVGTGIAAVDAVRETLDRIEHRLNSMVDDAMQDSSRAA